MDEPLVTEPGDHELIGAVRSGDPDAFGTLYTRHVEAARRLAYALAGRSAEADDLVGEAFTKLLDALRRGNGPDLAFRAYLLRTLRNQFYDRSRREGRVRVTEDLSKLDPGVPFEDTAVAGLERTLVARAFARLPERWQTVLWHTHVEGETPATVAPLLGLTPNGVSSLALRARERLRQNYLREHVSTSPTECRSTVDRLGAYVRSGLSRRDRAAVGNHLAGCRRCQVLYLELGDVNASLRTVLAPVVLGEASTVTAYLGGAGGPLTHLWTGVKQLSRRRSTQVAAGAAVAAGLALALVLLLTASEPAWLPAPPPAPPAGPGPDPGAAPPAVPAPGDEDSPGSPPVTPPAPGSPAPPGQPPLDLAVALEPVGSLVRDRPGVLALTATAVEPGGSGGGLATAPIWDRLRAAPSGPRSHAPYRPTTRYRPAPPETGPLTAVVTVPAGVRLRAGDPGGGWTCSGTGGGIRCRRGSLPAGDTTSAFLPVTVAAGATGIPRVRVTGPGIAPASAAAAGEVGADGFGAVYAGSLPATVVTGGNALLSCAGLDLTCGGTRIGERGLLGRTDNDHYLMSRYADPHAPPGAPARAAVSGATIRVPGEVVWAGLYWAGSGDPPYSPTAYLRAPGGGSYVPVAATTVRTAELAQHSYQAAAEVTRLVRGGGEFWVAVGAGAFDGGVGSFGGWALVLVVTSDGSDRLVAVFDELTSLPAGGSFSTALYGNPGPARVGFVAWEGDRGLAGDRLRLAEAALDGDNVAAARAAGTPVAWHTFGTDARVLEGTIPEAPSGHRRPILSATTRQDAWLLGPVAVVSPASAVPVDG